MYIIWDDKGCLSAQPLLDTLVRDPAAGGGAIDDDAQPLRWEAVTAGGLDEESRSL